LKAANSSRPEDKKAQGSSGESKKPKANVEDKKQSSEDKEEKEKDKNEEADNGAGDDSQEVTKPPRRATQPLGRTRPKSGSSKNGSGTKRLLQNATLSNGVEDAWGAWSDDCRSFDERRPCQNGNRVGFQSRQCLRTPFECQGPFFRYCIAPCQGALQ